MASAEFARLLTLGFHGTSVPPELRRLLRLGLGGVILFQRNIESPRQLLELVRELKAAATTARPLLVCIDQEGGRVARLRGAPWTPIPPMRAFGNLPHDVAAQRVSLLGRLLGRELRSVGLDLDFAPVLDTDTNPANPVIGDRSFSADPHRVAVLGAALVSGLQAEGVAACGKHFPGHGDTTADSHLELPRLSHDRARLDSVELVPFRTASRAGVAAIMTAHVICTGLDAALPATLSPAALAVLRREIDFGGAIVSDDLEMAAVAQHWPIEESSARAVAAGCDQLIVSSDLELAARALDGLGTAVAAGRLAADRVRDASRRWDDLAQQYAGAAADEKAFAWLGSPEHERAAAAVLGA